MRILFIGFLSLLSINTFATNVAVLDFRIAILQSAAGQEAIKEPQAQLSAMEKQLQQEQTELQEMSIALKNDELTLSQEEFQRRQRELAQRNAALRTAAANMQRQAKQMEQQLLESFKAQAEVLLKKIIEDQKIELVLNRQVSVYSVAGVDITNELTRRMNEGK